MKLTPPKCTEGEWRCGTKGKFGTSHPACIQVGEDRTIAHAYGVFDNMRLEQILADPKDAKHCEEGLANARLMAASKKLGEALNEALEHLMELDPVYYRQTVMYGRIRAALLAAGWTEDP